MRAWLRRFFRSVLPPPLVIQIGTAGSVVEEYAVQDGTLVLNRRWIVREGEQ